jgi:hypothetical protein
MTDLDSLDKRLDTVERDMRALNEQLDEIKRNVRNEGRTARQAVVFDGVVAVVLGIGALVVWIN